MTEGFDTHKANETTNPAEDLPYYRNAGIVNRGATAGTDTAGAIAGDTGAEAGDTGAEAGLEAARATGNAGAAGDYTDGTRGPR